MSIVVLSLGVWLLTSSSSSRLLPARGRRLPLAGHDLAALLAGAGVLVVIGRWWGLLPAAGAVLGARAVLARMDSETPQRREQTLRQGPDAVDCLASCVSAGAPLWTGMVVVADAFGGPVGEVLRRCAARHRLGAPHEETFAQLLDDPVLAPVGRVLLRSVESGASLSAALSTCAEQMRHTRGADLENRARAVGVKAVLPLAGCFLPAFIVLAVVPIVGSLMTGLF